MKGSYHGNCGLTHLMQAEVRRAREVCYRSQDLWQTPTLREVTAGPGNNKHVIRQELGGDPRTPVKCSSTVMLKLFRCKGCGCVKREKGRTTRQLVKMQLDHHLNQIKGRAPMAHCNPWFVYADTMIRNVVGKIRREMVDEMTAKCADVRRGANPPPAPKKGKRAKEKRAAKKKATAKKSAGVKKLKSTPPKKESAKKKTTKKSTTKRKPAKKKSTAKKSAGVKKVKSTPPKQESAKKKTAKKKSTAKKKKKSTSKLSGARALKARRVVSIQAPDGGYCTAKTAACEAASPEPLYVITDGKSFAFRSGSGLCKRERCSARHIPKDYLRMTAEPQVDGSVVFRASNGKYCSGGKGRRFACDREEPTTKFRVRCVRNCAKSLQHEELGASVALGGASTGSWVGAWVSHA